MRLAHLADLHLGRVFHANNLVEDQAHVLTQALDLFRHDDVDALVLAGDLYDRTLPGREAVRLLDWFLREVNESVGIPVIAIAGNHDSAEHLGFGAWMFRRDDLHVRGRIERDAPPITIDLPDGEVTFYALPYVEPEAAREWLVADGEAAEDTAVTHRDTVRAMLRHARAHRESSGARRAVVVAHAFVQGERWPEESRRSERSLYLGGVGAVPAGDFEGFSYVALGHLHRPQAVSPDGRVRYAGSLMKYAFDEWNHAKGLSLVDLDEAGEVRVEHRVLTPRRDLVRLEGSLAELLTRPEFEAHRGCFVSAEITDRPPPLQAMERLRERFPHAAELRFRALALVSPEIAATAPARDHDPVEAFEAFFTRETGAAPTAREREAFAEALAWVRAQEAR